MEKEQLQREIECLNSINKDLQLQIRLMEDLHNEMLEHLKETLIAIFKLSHK